MVTALIRSPTDRQRLDREAEHYLHYCYETRTAARASEFASFLGFTPPYLSRIVPILTGMCVRKYLRNQQLAHAVSLLMTTEAPIDQIALRCGFGTPWTFYRCFRSFYGTTPAAYRQDKK